MSFLDDMKRKTRETRVESRARQAEGDAARREARLGHISGQCAHLASSLRSEIERDARGERYPKWHAMGFSHHWLVDQEGGHLKITKHWDGITLADIAATPGFAELKAQCDFLGVIVGLREEPDDEASLEQETTVFSVIVAVSGWG